MPTIGSVVFPLVPFVRAVAGTFGSRLDGVVDAATREAVRGLLDRVFERSRAPDALGPAVRATLRAESGARVILDDALPAEALAQLVHLSHAEVPAGTIFWRPRASAGGRWHLERDGVVRAHWDRATRRWQSRDA